MAKVIVERPRRVEAITRRGRALAPEDLPGHGGMRARPGDDLWFQPFYVDPRTGLLCSTARKKARSFLKKRTRKLSFSANE